MVDLGKIHVYSNSIKTLITKLNPISVEENSKPKNKKDPDHLENVLTLSQYFGDFFHYIGLGSEIIGIISIIFLLDSLHIFVNFSQLLKTLLVFRFTKVYFGDILEVFMEDLEGRLDPKKIKNYDEYLKIRKGERGKLS